MAKERCDVPQGDRWNVEDMYSKFEDWKSDFDSTCCKHSKPRWPELVALKGKLGDSPSSIKTALEESFSISRQLSKLYTYAHLKHDEDITNDQFKGAQKLIIGAIQDFQEESAWLEPELLAIPDATITSFLNSPILAEYRFYLEKILRTKLHILSADQEQLMALAGQALQASQKAFSAINDADFKFGKVVNNEGQELELTHASYGLFMRDHDRTLRKNSFLQMHGVYEKFENTLCELINGQVQAHVFNARARKYPSCLEAALFPNNIPAEVYHSLIQAVHDGIGSLHKYIALRKRMLGLDHMHLYDMSVPLTDQFDLKVPYEEAEDLIITSVAPLGHEYQNILKAGFKDQRWVDRYENKNKRSGAYSSGCYDSMPYILMNYKQILRDVFTLAHEGGHSMHSYLSHKNQPYQYGDYSIFVAEVASTFNEELLTRLLIQRAKSREEKIYLITQKIEDIRGTLFRQTMFAEFELFVHTMAEKNIPLTPALLKKETLRLNELYFGPLVHLDPVAQAEWSRIPHFYYNFYVYQYATGISAALALSDRVVEGGATERNEYLSFLKGGSSRYPIDMLKVAGVDMRTPQPVNAAIKKFERLVTQLEDLALNKE